MGREERIELVREHDVTLIEMGHAHYNEVANDEGEPENTMKDALRIRAKVWSHVQIQRVQASIELQQVELRQVSSSPNKNGKKW